LQYFVQDELLQVPGVFSPELVLVLKLAAFTDLLVQSGKCQKRLQRIATIMGIARSVRRNWVKRRRAGFRNRLQIRVGGSHAHFSDWSFLERDHPIEENRFVNSPIWNGHFVPGR
jgi:hypothetical protein